MKYSDQHNRSCTCAWVKPFLLILYCLYHMHLFSTTVAFKEGLRRCGVGFHSTRRGWGRMLTQRRTSGMEINDVDITKAMTTQAAATGTPSSSSTSGMISSHSEVIDNTDLLRHYRTLLNTTLCDASCIVTTTPSSDTYDFTKFVLNGEGNAHNKGIVYTHNEHDLLTEEVIFGRSKEKNMKGEVNKRRLNIFLGGRIALRRAFKSLLNDAGNDYVENMLPTISLPPLYSNGWGAPTLPASITASISHKDDLAVGVAKIDSTGSVGVDLEHCNNKAATTIMRRVITATEKDNLGNLEGVSMEEEVLLRFSFKEAIYKAIHPILRRSIDFAEVEVQPLDNGTAIINFMLKSGEKFEYDASWQRYRDKYWLTCVYVRESERSDRSTQTVLK